MNQWSEKQVASRFFCKKISREAETESKEEKAMELYQWVMLAVAVLASLKVFFAMVLPDLRGESRVEGGSEIGGMDAGRACTMQR